MHGGMVDQYYIKHIHAYSEYNSL